MKPPGSPPVRVPVPPFIVELVTPLDEGSDNKGSGTKILKAMLVDHTYQFVAKAKQGHSCPDLSGLLWEVTYTSLAPSSSKKPITRKCTPEIKGAKVELCLLKQFGDHALDMCGAGTVMTGANKMSTGITVRAYLSSTVHADSKPVPVHCRYHWFDARRVKEQAQQRMTQPWRIDQGQTGLCGMAAVYTAMILRGGSSERKPGPHTKDYLNLATELHRKGIYTPTCRNPYTIRPQPLCYEVNPMKDQDFHDLVMWEVDFITLAGTESSDNASLKEFYVVEETKNTNTDILVEALLHKLNLVYVITKEGEDQASLEHTGAYSPRVMKMLTGGAGFSSAVDHTRLGTRTAANTAATIETTTGELQILQAMNRLYQSGKGQFPILIDAQMLPGSMRAASASDHWVLYAGNLNLNTPGMVSFEVFTWGRDPDTGKYYVVPSDIPSYFAKQGKEVGPDTGDLNANGIPRNPNAINVRRRISTFSFAENFYGYIEADN